MPPTERPLATTHSRHARLEGAAEELGDFLRLERSEVVPRVERGAWDADRV